MFERIKQDTSKEEQHESGVLGWLTPAERYDGTPFTDRGFENIAALAHLQPWLQATMPAA